MSETKKHYYAVRKGRRPGIFTRWTGQGGAEEQIKGFPGAVFRGFVTRAEAEYFLRTGEVMPAPPALVAADASAPSARSSAVEYSPDLAAGKTVIFTDGASTGNPGPGGYGAILMTGDSRKELSGGFRCTTNNRMELMGVITALQSLPGRSQVVLFTDSRYVVNSVQLGWAKRWRARGWMRDSVNRAENADLWAHLLDLLEQHTVEFRWVKGHANHPENERCDQLAVQAAKQKGLAVDAGFQGRC